MALADALKDNCSVTSIDLCCKMRRHAMRTKFRSSLSALFVVAAGNRVGDQGAESLAAALAINVNVTKLNIRGES